MSSCIAQKYSDHRRPEPGVSMRRGSDSSQVPGRRPRLTAGVPSPPRPAQPQGCISKVTSFSPLGGVAAVTSQLPQFRRNADEASTCNEIRGSESRYTRV